MTNFFSATIHNAIAVPSLLLKALGVKFNQTSLTQLLEDHPHFPSLLAISDSLTAWGIPNQTYQIAKEDFNEDELLFPFIAATNTNGGSFVLVNKIENGLVYTDRENNDFEPPTISEFLHCWKGIALHAELTAESGEPNYAQNKFISILNSLLAPTTILALIVVLYLAFASQGFSWPILALSILKLGGVGVSIAIDAKFKRQQPIY